MNDANLENRLRELAAADPAAATVLAVKSYGPELFGLLLNMLGNRADAQEAFQQASLDLWQGLPSFRWLSSFRTWSYAVTCRAGLRCQRNRQRRTVRLSECPELEAVVRTTTAPFLRTSAQGAMQRIRERLTPQERALLVLRVDRAMTWEDVAQCLEVRDEATSPATRVRAAQTVRQRYRRLKEKLKGMLQAEGLLEQLP